MAQLSAKLEIKQKELSDANAKVQVLKNDFEITERNKIRLENEYLECQKQLARAEILIVNLGGEKGRWGELAVSLKLDYTNLTGDILVSAGMIAYLGAFTFTYRVNIAKEWVDKNLSLEIPSSKTFSLPHILGDPVKVR